MGRQVVLAIIPKFSAALSIVGSGWIVVEVSTNASKRKNVYHRLLLAMAVYDILESIFNFFSTWPIPRGTENIFGAVGNTATCTAQGFFLQLGLAIPIYNAGLSIYYLLVLRYGLTDARVEKFVEPLMHFVAFAFPFGTSMTAVVKNLFNNANLWCWIAPYPLDCMDSRPHGAENSTCIRGDNAWIYRWAFYFIPLWMCILVAMFVMIFVYWTVLEKEMASVKKKNAVPINGATTSIDAEYFGSSNSSWGFRPQRHVESLGTLQEEEATTTSSATTSPAPSDHNDNNTGKKATAKDTKDGAAGGPETDDNDSNDNNVPRDDDTAISQHDDMPFGFGIIGAVVGGGNTTTITTTPATTSHSTLRRRRRSLLNRGTRRSQQVLGQGLCYLGAFYMTHLFSTINRSLQLSIGDTFFPLLVLHAFFDPLQGFLNFLVYRRPVYMRNRKIDPEISRITAWIRAFQFSNRPNEFGSSRFSASALTRGMSPSEAAAFRLAVTQEKGRKTGRRKTTGDKPGKPLLSSPIPDPSAPLSANKELMVPTSRTAEPMPAELLHDSAEEEKAKSDAAAAIAAAEGTA